jgi:hypothetical protein
MENCDTTPALIVESGKIEPYFGKQALSTHDGSHDTFDETKHVNWLVNGAGIGIYVHGRIHQQLGPSIYVGDLIHKRGHLATDDLLLMEEQALLSMGEPLATNSRLGDLVALAVLPTMNTANGEGDLIAYYQFGVVSYNTFEAPRESRFDGEGKQVQKGWDSKRLVNHLLNHVSAVARYAVVTLTRDHLFRSLRGLHFLKVVLGEGTFNSENVNRVSTDVDPILEKDVDLSGAAVGFWIAGDRMFASTGLITDTSFSTTSLGRGFVSWHQAVSFTDDRTPIPAWEGLWVVDFEMAGIHKFTSAGFVCSGKNKKLYLAEFDKVLAGDLRDGIVIPVEWSMETARVAPDGISSKISIKGCVLEFACMSTQAIRVLIKTDNTGAWIPWKTLTIPDKVRTVDQLYVFSETLGAPPQQCREATWAQVRVEGIGATELRLIELDYSSTIGKAGRTQSYIANDSDIDFFITNNSPTSSRWR